MEQTRLSLPWYIVFFAMDATKSTLLQPDLGLQLVAARDGRSAAERAAQAQRNRVDGLAYQAAATRKDIAATLAKASLGPR